MAARITISREWEGREGIEKKTDKEKNSISKESEGE